MLLFIIILLFLLLVVLPVHGYVGLLEKMWKSYLFIGSDTMRIRMYRSESLTVHFLIVMPFIKAG